MTETPAPSPALTLPTDAAHWPGWVRDRADTELDAARDLVERVRRADTADAREVLTLWDRASGHLGNAAAAGSLFANVHPDRTVRDLADSALQEVSKLSTAWSLDAELFAVFDGLDASTVADDPLASRMLTKVLDDFRRSGVDQDDATRERITAISERLTTIGQHFGKLTRDDVRTIRIAPERLAGLPADWLEEHPADEDGLVTVTTDYPDSLPVRTFARDRDVRRDMSTAFLRRGWPDAEPLLLEMFALRHELATLTGFADWPSYDADVKMIGTGPAIPEFIDKISAAAAEPLERDLAVLLERYRADFPDAERVEPYDAIHYQELVRAEQYDVDAQRVRTYYDFAKVRRGLLDVTGRLFGLRYAEIDVPVWHAEVAAYDVFLDRGDQAGTNVGRIYLDLHPREGKYSHAAQFTLTDGVAGVQRPEGVLVCNFSRGLMEHDHVTTLFHEFGHLLHHVLGGHGDWFRFAGVATEWDFVEAPSQMLEEWAWDAAVLQSFATNAAGEPIPADLVARMKAADDYGKGIYARTQMFYAAMSYWFHQDVAVAAASGAEPPALTDRMIELQEQYAALPYLEGTHMFASFGHLGGYSSAYYTYMWSMVIAKDLFSAFGGVGADGVQGDDLFDAEVAGRYRDRVLARGGEADAADLVADFLGRPYSFDAYAAWLAR